MASKVGSIAHMVSTGERLGSSNIIENPDTINLSTIAAIRGEHHVATVIKAWMDTWAAKVDVKIKESLDNLQQKPTTGGNMKWASVSRPILETLGALDWKQCPHYDISLPEVFLGPWTVTMSMFSPRRGVMSMPAIGAAMWIVA